jgi:hypothetical protein
MRTHQGLITSLKDNEVFIFGCNLSGFHGAGAAGYATFGEPGNVWRKYGYDKWPNGKKGKWNVKGKTGPMVGTEGKSYGLPTVTHAGAKRSLVPDFRPLFECCRRNPDWTFYLAQEGGAGLNGWAPEEMARFMKDAGELPPNLSISKSFAPFLA